jgi:hypothetical protein
MVIFHSYVKLPEGTVAMNWSPLSKACAALKNIWDDVSG